MEVIYLKPSEMVGVNPFGELPILGENSFIAGGAVRSWFQGEPLSDIDIFFSDSVLLASYLEKLENSGWAMTRNNDSLIDLEKYNTKVQLIKKYFKSPEEAFSSFDYHLCQFSYDGIQIKTTKEAILSVLRKRLSVNKISPEYRLDSLRRAFKYFEKGYKPCSGCLADIGLSLGMATEDVLKQTEFYPNGTRRIVRFD